MSHIEYFTQDSNSGLESSVVRLEQAIDSFLQLVYGEPAELDSSASLATRIGAVAAIIEGLA